MTTVLIVSAIPAVRAGLSALLAGSDEVEVAGELARVDELTPVPSGVEVIVTTEGISPDALDPILPDPPAVALLLVNDNPDIAGAMQALPLRAWGLLPNDATAEELSAAIRALSEGLFVGAPQLVRPLLGQANFLASGVREPLDESLTPREAEVLQLVAYGLANKEIARRLGISEHTVKFHISSIYGKLGVMSRTEAVRRGARRGLVTF